MNLLVIDVEGPIDGHPFNPADRLSLIGLYNGSTYHIFDIEHIPNKPYGQSIPAIQKLVDAADVLIAFNAKYDLHWLRRYQIQFSHKRLWCLQYAEFCMSGQTWPYPDLATACTKRNLGEGKSDYIWETYWSKGIPTTEIPLSELVAYNQQDLKVEHLLFNAQVEYLKDKEQLKKLIWHGCQDLLITEEMEWNGLKYDHEKSLRTGDEFLKEIASIDSRLSGLVDGYPVLWSSSSDISAVLYGGVVKEEVKEPYIFTYKDGRQIEKIRKVIKEYTLPKLVEPLKGSKNTKGWSTDEGTLKRLRASGSAKQIIGLLLRKRELDKKVGTYYHGLPKLAKEMKWEDNLLHGQLNHCRAASGRLSSSKPNQQNLDYDVRACIVTRFPLSTPITT